MSAVAAGLALLLFQSSAGLFEKAPPAVDEALRVRITKFYQAHVQGKFRAADEVVAEDSKDAFFAADKTRCYSFEIVQITYSENFTRASAVVTCEMDFSIPGADKVRVKAPRTTFWKVVDGQWWWYVVPTEYHETPFGKMHSGPPGPASSTPVSPPSQPNAFPRPSPADVTALMNPLKADKAEVRLRADKPGSDQVTVTNRLAGAVSLELHCPSLPGLEMTLDRKELNKGEVAHVSIRFEPKDKLPADRLTAQIRVPATGQVLPIRLIFEPPQ
jgi:hypothetical protein